jgi:hypothetical protein
LVHGRFVHGSQPPAWQILFIIPLVPTPCPCVDEDPAAEVIEFVMETANKISSTDDTE